MQHTRGMASTGEPWRLGRRPALDGVRGLAILLVVLGHSQFPRFAAGGVVGVTLFFTLSGFLITALLLEEHTRSGRVGLGAFYLRRARRLLPALVASTALVAAAGAVIGSWFFQWRDALAVLGYVGNWVQVHRSMGGLAGTWSLAVEEQFYLLWPAVVIFCLRRRVAWLITVSVLGVAASMAARVWLWSSGASVERAYYGSDAHADALLMGCLLAAALHGRPARGSGLPWAAPAFGAVFLVATFEGPVDTYQLAPALVPSLASSATWLRWGPLTWLGRRSYGLYLYHCPVAAYLTLAHPEVGWQWRLPIMLAVALPLTVLSWRYVEEPFLKRASHPVQVTGRTVEPARAPAAGKLRAS